MRSCRTRSPSHEKRRCDLWRRLPLSGPPVSFSNASSLALMAFASASLITRTGKTQPSRQYWSICFCVRIFGILLLLLELKHVTTEDTELHGVFALRP